MVVDDGQLDAEEQEKLHASAEAALQEALERDRAAAAAKELAELEAKQRRGVLGPAVAVLAKLPFRRAKP